MCLSAGFVTSNAKHRIMYHKEAEEKTMHRRKPGKGTIVVAFGIGLLLAVCFPEKALIVILAAVLVLCGFFLCTR